MKGLYLILGYGVPKDIISDGNYRTYLSHAFNSIWDDPLDPKIIVVSGGLTDMIPPYLRTEADEMKRFFTHLAERPALQNRTAQWEVHTEAASLNHAESLLNTCMLLNALGYYDFEQRIVIFCEWTRRHRILDLSSKVFLAAETRPIDFDVSLNRYLPAEEIANRESRLLALETRVIRERGLLEERYHKICLQRLERLRIAGPENHVDAVRAWYRDELDNMTLG